MIRGKLYWAKILGAPRENNFGKKQWSIEVEPDAKSLALLKELGLKSRLKDPTPENKHTKPFFAFYQDELKADGTKADPVRVVDAGGQPWNNGLIGNESVGDIKFVVRDYGKAKQKGVYIRAVRVLEHVPYVVQEFAPLTEDDEFFAEEEDTIARLPEGLEPDFDTEEENNLDDDIPE